MPYKLTDAAWLAYETERAKGVLTVHMEHDQEYTIEELLAMLHDYGLDYSNPQYVEIGAALIADGTLEAVP